MLRTRRARRALINLRALALTGAALAGCERGAEAPTSASSPSSVTSERLPWIGSRPSRRLVTPEALALLKAREALSEDLLDIELLAAALAAAARGALDEAAALALEAGRLDESARFEAWRLAAEVGGCDEAREALERLSSPPPPRAWGGERLAGLERALVARCEPARLKAVEATLARKHPALAARLGVSVPPARPLSFDDELKRALALERALLNEQAAHALEALSARAELTAEQRWLAEWELLRVRVERLRASYEGAAQRLDALARLPGAPSKQRWREARLLAAKAWSKAGDARRARGVYEELIREWGFSAEAAEARFLLAFELYERQEWRAAAEAFAALCRHKGDEARARRAGRPEQDPKGRAAAAEWYHAWSLYQHSPARAALFLEAQVGEGEPLSEEARRAAYWAAEAWAPRDPKRAEELRGRLLDSSPHDWYALLLRARYPALRPDLPPLRLPRELVLEGREGGDARVSRRARRLARAEELGLRDLADYERTLAEGELREGLKGLGEPAALRRLAWARGLGLVELGLRVSVGLSPARRHAAPRAEEGLWWQLAYPWGFADEVSRAAAAEGRAESALMSFIRKESAFAPRARSPAQALGLMQLLTKTAQGAAAWAPAGGAPLPPLASESLPEALYDPATNALLGARYLRALSIRYHEQLPLVALAYNAGPAALGAWLRAAEDAKGAERLDLFVERVPFREARGYVKRVVQGVCLYELLYGEQSLNSCAARLPMSLRLEAREGVGF